jgi:hypothetical protein
MDHTHREGMPLSGKGLAQSVRLINRNVPNTLIEVPALWRINPCHRKYEGIARFPPSKRCKCSPLMGGIPAKDDGPEQFCFWACQPDDYSTSFHKILGNLVQPRKQVVEVRMKPVLHLVPRTAPTILMGMVARKLPGFPVCLHRALIVLPSLHPTKQG